MSWNLKQDFELLDEMFFLSFPPPKMKSFWANKVLFIF